MNKTLHLNKITNDALNKVKDVSAAERILDRLGHALSSDGDFPARAKNVADLQRLADDPGSTVDQISKVILREPSLGTRILHLVNSAFYARPEPVMTVSQAVIQLGVKAITQLCAGLILMQHFTATASRGSVFGDNLKRSILTSLIASKLVPNPRGSGNAERGYLAGAFYNLGYLLLSYYFPQVYDAAAKRARARGQGAIQSLSEILGVTRAELTDAVLANLDIPDYYQKILSLSAQRMDQLDASSPNYEFVVCLKTAGALAEIIVDHESTQQLTNTIWSLTDSGGFGRDTIGELIRSLPEMFREHCTFIGLDMLSIPDELQTFGLAPVKSSHEVFDVSSTKLHSAFSDLLHSVKSAIGNREPISSVLALVMESLAYDLDFDRVFLLVGEAQSSILKGKMAVGLHNNIDPLTLSVDRNRESPITLALEQGIGQVLGEPLLADGWPFIALPIGLDDTQFGVIYADALDNRRDEKIIDDRLLTGFTLLIELLDRVVKDTAT